MLALRRIFLASLFFVAVLAISFCLYPEVRKIVDFLNGFYEYYGRVPWDFVTPLSVAFDLGLSSLAATAMFYGFARWRAKRAIGSATVDAPELKPAKTAPGARPVRIELRLWLVLAWFAVQCLYDLIAKTIPSDGPLTYRLLEALSWMTAPVQIFLSLIALAVIWRQPWKKHATTAERDTVAK